MRLPAQHLVGVEKAKKELDSECRPVIGRNQI
jgi:hypothetical protein